MANKRMNMDRANRAKQFMPFDALKGFREALALKERVLVPRRELSEDLKEELNRRLMQLQKNDIITAEYFQDGVYLRITGMIAGISLTAKVLTIVNTRISFDDIASINCGS